MSLILRRQRISGKSAPSTSFPMFFPVWKFPAKNRRKQNIVLPVLEIPRPAWWKPSGSRVGTVTAGSEETPNSFAVCQTSSCPAATQHGLGQRNFAAVWTRPPPSPTSPQLLLGRAVSKLRRVPLLLSQSPFILALMLLVALPAVCTGLVQHCRSHYWQGECPSKRPSGWGGG